MPALLPPELSSLGGAAAAAADPSMNALEILREALRVLRGDPSHLLTVFYLLICPFSAALLSKSLVPAAAAAAVASLSRRLVLLTLASGLPLSHFIEQLCGHLSPSFLSWAFCFPLSVSLLAVVRSGVAYSAACSLAGKEATVGEFSDLLGKIWRRVVSTNLWVFAVVSVFVSLLVMAIVMACRVASLAGFPRAIYPAAATAAMASCVVYAHVVVVCNLASCVSVLEDSSGLQALRRSASLIKGGRLQAGLLVFLWSATALAFVEWLFEHRVRTLSYGDGSSRVWEGPLLLIMHSFLVLVDSMMNAVFYLTCRSCHADANGQDTLQDEDKDLLGYMHGGYELPGSMEMSGSVAPPPPPLH